MRYTLGSLHRRLELSEEQATMLVTRCLIRLCDGCTSKRLVDGRATIEPVNVYHLESVFSSSSTGWAEVEDALQAAVAGITTLDENFEYLVTTLMSDCKSLGAEEMTDLRRMLASVSPNGMALKALDEAVRRLQFG